MKSIINIPEGVVITELMIQRIASLQSEEMGLDYADMLDDYIQELLNDGDDTRKTLNMCASLTFLRNIIKELSNIRPRNKE